MIHDSYYLFINLFVSETREGFIATNVHLGAVMIWLKCATVMIAVSRLPIIIKAKTMGQSVSQAGPFLLSNPAYSGVRSLRRRERFAKSRLSPTGSERFPMENGTADRHELQSAGSGVLYNEGIRIRGISSDRRRRTILKEGKVCGINRLLLISFFNFSTGTLLSDFPRCEITRVPHSKVSSSAVFSLK